MDGKLGDRPPHPLPWGSSIVAIAISRKKKNGDMVEWAIEKLASGDNVKFKLIHVRPRITSVPTPMGAAVPISEIREDVAIAYKQEIEWQTNQMLLPYKKMCEKRKVPVDVLVVEADDVPAAISNEITSDSIGRLVIGVSPRGYFSRKIDMCSIIAASAPTFCTVYAVSKGKLSSIRPSSDSETRATLKELKLTREISGASVSLTGTKPLALPLPKKIPVLALPAANDDVSKQTSPDGAKDDSRRMALVEAEETEITRTESLNRSLSEPTIGWITRLRDLEEFNDDKKMGMKDIMSRHSRNIGSNLSDDLSQGNLSFEIEKLREELRQVQNMYEMSQTEAIDEDDELKLVKEQESGQLMEAKKPQEMVVATENRGLGRVGSAFQFQHFTWEEIVEATSGFSDDLKIGTGTYGTVYECSLHHTTAAVKVLHSAENMMNKRFQQELEILSRTRHRHLVLLLGACIDRGCLVYEFMENGSLQDRLLQHNNTPPIPWFERFRIAHEVASALLFLHRSTSIPIIHRGLKPANILLDRNFVSKLADVGLCATSRSNTITSLSVSNLCYTDPEYHRTGIVSPKSDVYAFGMVILQLLTAKSAAGIAMAVERSIRNHGEFLKILDQKAGNWPIKETIELAALGLCCTELRTKDRPDLKDQILPALEKFRKVGEEAKNMISGCLCAPPAHFICPLLKDVMTNPCVASDGYTYDRGAIEEWLKEHETSPMTNMPLPDKCLIPNHPLLIAITEWRSTKR